MNVNPTQISGPAKAPEYKPKVVTTLGDQSIMTENYIEEVKYILDQDRNGYDDKGNQLVSSDSLFVKFMELIGISQSDSCYYEYDEAGNMIAEYIHKSPASLKQRRLDDEFTIDIAVCYKYDENGNQTGKFLDRDNNNHIDEAEYYKYDENGNQIRKLIDKDNNGEIDEAEYYKYDEKGKKVASWFDKITTGILKKLNNINYKYTIKKRNKLFLFFIYYT